MASAAQELVLGVSVRCRIVFAVVGLLDKH